VHQGQGDGLSLRKLASMAVSKPSPWLSRTCPGTASHAGQQQRPASDTCPEVLAKGCPASIRTGRRRLLFDGAPDVKMNASPCRPSRWPFAPQPDAQPLRRVCMALAERSSDRPTPYKGEFACSRASACPALGLCDGQILQISE